MKGKRFERINKLIQEAFKDSPSTEILSNYKIETEPGQKNEIDILIVSKLNGFDIKIAIECKDFAKKVPVEKIDAFESKCNRINNINSKVFISSNGYQKGAIAAAKRFGIILCTTSKITADIVKQWIPIHQLNLTMLPGFGRTELLFESEDKEYLKELGRGFDETIFNINKEKIGVLAGIMVDGINERRKFIHNIALVEWLRINEDKKHEPFPLGFEISLEGVYVKDHLGKYVPLLGLKSSINVQFKLSPANIMDAHIYKDSSGVTKANSISIDVGNNLSSEIIITNKDQPDIYLSNQDGQVQKLQTLLVYDPKTDRFSKG
jgi:hypothetical protein